MAQTWPPQVASPGKPAFWGVEGYRLLRPPHLPVERVVNAGTFHLRVAFSGFTADSTCIWCPTRALVGFVAHMGGLECAQPVPAPLSPSGISAAGLNGTSSTAGSPEASAELAGLPCGAWGLPGFPFLAWRQRKAQ